MSVLPEEHVHLFPNLEVYPRIHYFYRLYSDLLARFSRVTGALPKCFKNEKVVHQLEQVKDEFNGGIKVCLFGRDIGNSELVFNAHYDSHAYHYKTEIAICHLSPDGRECEVTKARFKAFKLDAEKAGHKIFVFIKCNQTLNKEETARFQDAAFAAFSDDLKEYFHVQSNIFINTNAHDTRTTISDELERHLAGGFVKIYSHVKLFESINVGISLKPIHIFEDNSPVRDLLRNPRAFVEIQVNENENKDHFYHMIFYHLLKSLGHIIRCSLVVPFARKFGLKVSICNGLMCELRFEEAVLAAITEKTKLHIKEMAIFVYENLSGYSGHLKKMKSLDFDFLYDLIKSDVEPVIAEIEKKFHSMRRLSDVFKKMGFETIGYLNQLEIECVHSGTYQMPNLSKELRSDLLGIEEVYGVGVMFGYLEIHVDKNKVTTNDFSELKDAVIKDVHDGQVSDLQNQGRKSIAKVNSEIASFMYRHGYVEKYAVKYIEKKHEEMMSSFEPGDRLFERDKTKFGTLGGFIVTKDETVHGLTCAHVVRKRMFVDKGQPEPFSSRPKVVNRENSVLMHIDIAALEVIPLNQDKCKQTLRESNECITKAILSYEHPKDIVGTTVFKCGAASGITKGFVVSVDYSLLGPEADDYLLIIDTHPDLPKDFDEKFEPIYSANDQNTSQPKDELNSFENAVREKADNNFVNDNDKALNMTNTNTLQGMECNTMNAEIEHTKCEHGKTVVYVKNTTCNETLMSNDGRNLDGAFAQKGDSGSIICIHEATCGNIKQKALSMLSAGDLKIDGDESLKCLSFKLNVGLEKLKEIYGLDI